MFPFPELSREKPMASWPLKAGLERPWRWRKRTQRHNGLRLGTGSYDLVTGAGRKNNIIITAHIHWCP